MIPISRKVEYRSEAFPRVCGGDPGEKGWWKGQLWLFPACAGVILYPRPEGGGKQSFPRVCGGDPKDKHQYNVTDILFPACAGVIPVRYFVHMDDPAFPRVCGVILYADTLTNPIYTFPRVCGGDPTGRI